MGTLRPQTPEELAEALAAAARQGNTVRLGGAFTKDRMGGPPAAADVVISTSALNRIVAYEPGDLTISVEAGLRFAELNRYVGEDGLMLPLDPPFHEETTVGGVVSADVSGPRRRGYGTARDLVIGMKFATLEGRLIQSGGMVVKNAAGLDMAKLMVGAFGTLAAVTVVNFRLVPIPPLTRTFVFSYDSAAEAFDARDSLLRSPLQPCAIDLLNPPAAARIGRPGYTLLVRAGGNQGVIERYTRELAGAEAVEGAGEKSLWEKVREFTPEFLAAHAAGAVVRVSSTIAGLREVLPEFQVPALARAGSGVCYGYFGDGESACAWITGARQKGWRTLIEHRPASGGLECAQWPDPGDDFGMMNRLKQMFDPRGLLNPGRLYGRL